MPIDTDRTKTRALQLEPGLPAGLYNVSKGQRPSCAKCSHPLIVHHVDAHEMVRTLGSPLDDPTWKFPCRVVGCECRA